MDNVFEISNDVQKAIDLKKPIVALESTLISHGLPYPENIKVAKESISAVEDNGSVAATIGIINGKVKIGLNEDDINILAKDNKVQKVSKIHIGCRLCGMNVCEHKKNEIDLATLLDPNIRYYGLFEFNG